MKVKLLHSTPLWIASTAIRKCWASEDKSDTGYCPQCNTDIYGYMFDEVSAECNKCGTFFDPKKCGDKDKELIHRVGNKNKHSSTLEHLNYTFDIDGISRACLQELARHRHASLSVKSTRYTLKELKNNCSIYNSNIAEGVTWRWDEIKKYVVLTGNHSIDDNIASALCRLQNELQDGISNDIAKYCLPEAYKTSLVWTINARSLQNFLSLRTSKSALWEIRDLAYSIYDNLPNDHKYLFEEYIVPKED